MNEAMARPAQVCKAGADILAIKQLLVALVGVAGSRNQVVSGDLNLVPSAELAYTDFRHH